MQIIDSHNHSLPGIDDGAKNLSMALEMLKVAEASGTQEIILTPHHLNGAFSNFSDQIIEQTNLLKTAAVKNNINIKLHTGSEVHLTPETVEHLIEKKALTYCSLGKASLIELPKHGIPFGAETILSELIYHGITPIIAHPERNSSLRTDWGPLKDWISFGCKSQVTGQSCSGSFGPEIQSVTLSMISEGLVHLVASDAHRPTGRSPNLTKAATALTEYFGTEVCETLLANNPKKLIEGQELESLTIEPKTSRKVKRNKKTGKKKTSLRKRLKKLI